VQALDFDSQSNASHSSNFVTRYGGSGARSGNNRGTMDIDTAMTDRGATRRFRISAFSAGVDAIAQAQKQHSHDHPQCPGLYKIVQEKMNSSSESIFFAQLSCKCDVNHVEIHTHDQHALCACSGKHISTAQPLEVLVTIAGGGTTMNRNWAASGLGQPAMNPSTFAKEEELWWKACETMCSEEYKKNLLMEAVNAVRKEHWIVDSKGNICPAICVIIDGVYAKRSISSQKMDSLGGAAFMYGVVTEQPVSHRGQTRYNSQERKGKRVQCDCDGECQRHVKGASTTSWGQHILIGDDIHANSEVLYQILFSMNNTTNQHMKYTWCVRVGVDELVCMQKSKRP
jgi:hypothetical protein